MNSLLNATVFGGLLTGISVYVLYKKQQTEHVPQEPDDTPAPGTGADGPALEDVLPPTEPTPLPFTKLPVTKPPVAAQPKPKPVEPIIIPVKQQPIVKLPVAVAPLDDPSATPIAIQPVVVAPVKVAPVPEPVPDKPPPVPPPVPTPVIVPPAKILEPPITINNINIRGISSAPTVRWYPPPGYAIADVVRANGTLEFASWTPSYVQVTDKQKYKFKATLVSKQGTGTGWPTGVPKDARVKQTETGTIYTF